KFLSETIDQWCRSDTVFPTPSVVAGVLYLFSPRCGDPCDQSPHRLAETLGKIVGTPESEYLQAWPHRDESLRKALITALTAIVEESVKPWTDGSDPDPSSGSLARRMVEQIVAQQFVVFHHRETTRRDVNHWGI